MIAWLSVASLVNAPTLTAFHRDSVAAPRAVIEIREETPPPVVLRINASSTPKEMAHYIALRGEDLALSGGDIDIALSIVHSESRFRNIPNVNGSRYGIGPFQFIRSTWNKVCRPMLGEETSVWDSNDNIECGLLLVKNHQFGHWAWGSQRWWLRLPFTRANLL